MIDKFHVHRLLVAIPLKKALALIESAARTHGFEITETIDLDAFSLRQTGTNLNRKIVMVQMHKPAMTLGSALLDDILPLILPLRVIVRAIGDDTSVMYFPGWEITKDPETTQAQHCMNLLYREAVIEMALALRRAGMPDDAVRQSTQQKEQTDESSNDSRNGGFVEPGVGAAFRSRSDASTAQPVHAGPGGSGSNGARRNQRIASAFSRPRKGGAGRG